MNIVEQIIVAAANELVQDYCAFVNADMQFDGGEYSGRGEPQVPEGVAAAHNLIQELEYFVEQGHSEYACPGCGCEPGDGRTDGCEDPDGCGYFTCSAAKYPDDC